MSRNSVPNVVDGVIRLVVEAECTACGPIGRELPAGLEVIRRAMRHTAETGHVVILNGTVDSPEIEGLFTD